MPLPLPLPTPHHTHAHAMLPSLFSTLLLLVLVLGIAHAQQNDTQALLAFRASSDPHWVSLAAWNTSDCCGWAGVTCTRGGRVSRLSLRGRGLGGSIQPLLLLTELRVLVLSNNSFQGPLSGSFFTANWKRLWLLVLPSNGFSGPLPPSLSSLSRLRALDLSRNSFQGPVPGSLISLTRLLSLHLHHNNLTGTIPNLALPSLLDLSLAHNSLHGPIPPLFFTTNLTSLDLSFNNLSGPIPPSLDRFPTSSFYGNLGLCGPPLLPCNVSDVSSSPASPFATVPSIITTPSTSSPPRQGGAVVARKSASKLSLGAIVAIVVGDVVLLLVLAVIFVIYYQRSRVNTLGGGGFSDCKPSTKLAQDINCLPGQSKTSARAESSEKKAKKKLVFFDDGDVGGDGECSSVKMKKFELEDLLRASAEMLGKGSLGTAYKAVMEDGGCVAVKRLKEANTSNKKEFEQQMESIGRIRRHPNLVALRAFYYAKEEKLLVYDFMPNGSLFNLLHGNRGPGRVPLDWNMRVRIALGAARGIAHLHNSKIQHGNIKSSNVLLNSEWNACVSDFALVPLMQSSSSSSLVTTSVASGYEAPELMDSKRVSQRSDMYSFGVLLLEILTGKIPAQSLQDEGLDLPRWVQSVVREEWTAEVFDLELMHYKDNEEEMVSMLQIAMSCVSITPQQRPKMRQIVRMIEGVLRGEQSPLRDCSNDEGSSPQSISIS